MTSLATTLGPDAGPATRGAPMRALRTGGILLLVAFGLAACDDSGDGDDGGTPEGIETLGDDFQRAFNQSPNDEPLDASTLTIPSTPRIEPFDP